MPIQPTIIGNATLYCENCAYFKPTTAGGAGVCRRYPPKHVVMAEKWGSKFPETWADQWCGEHQANEEIMATRSTANVLRRLPTNDF
jgi:hypothetical protein